MSKYKLLPCPFCGSDEISSGEVLLSHEHDPDTLYMQTGCLSCGALGSKTKEDDIYTVNCDVAWNTRASPTTDTTTIDRAEYEAMKELVTLIKVARAWYWVAGDVDDEYRGHEMYPTQHASNKSPMWSAIENQLKAIDQARKQNAI